MLRKLLIFTLTLVMIASFGLFGMLAFNLIKEEGIPGVGTHFDPKATYYDLDVDVTEGGSVNVKDGKYEKGQVVNLSATAKDGYVFMGWYDEHDNYITSSLDYAFAMTGKTKLCAKFCVEPEEFEGTAAYYEELKGVGNDFSFTIKTDKDKEWIEDNLKIVPDDLIGTEWEGDAAVTFVVEDLGNGEFLITPQEEYEDGITYTAGVEENADGEISIQENMDEGETLTFSVEQEETSEIEEQEGIVYILATTPGVIVVDDGKAVGDEGDIEDKVTVPSNMGIVVGGIICIYYEKDASGNPVIDEKTIFGKAESVTPNGGGYVIVYGTPDITEIYANLDIYVDEEINFEQTDLEISDEVIEEIKYAFLSQESFQEFIASAQIAVEDTVKGTDLEVETLGFKDNFVDLMDINVSVKIKDSNIIVEIGASLNIPIKKNGNQVAHLTFRINNTKTIAINTIVNYKIKKWWFIPVGLSSYDFGIKTTTTDQFTFAVAVETDRGSSGDFSSLEKNFITEKVLQEFRNKKNNLGLKNNIKDIFKDAGYDNGTRREIKLAQFTHYFYVVSANIDVRFFVNFDIGGSAYYTSTSTNYTRIGVRSSNGGSGKAYYENGGSEKASEVVFAGHAEVAAGFSANAYISIAGLSKYVQAGIGAEAGLAVGVDGYVSVRSGQLAGCFETKLFFNAYLYYKVFTLSGRWNFAEKELVLVRLGYDNTLVNWNKYDNIMKDDYSISLINKQTDLFSLNDLMVNVYEVGGGISVEKIDWDSNKYKVDVSVVNGENLSYSNGKLIVKDGAPNYFEDTVKISVKSANVWGAFKDGNYVSYLPDLEIKVTYGDEDAYYEVSDNETQKAFREIYRTYNEANVEVLKEMLANLIDKAFNEEIDEVVIFEVMVNEYVNALFDTVKEYRELPSEGREMENKFVYGEANVFAECMSWINDMLDEEKEYNEEEFKQIVLDVENTEVLFKMIVAIEHNEDFEEFASKFNLTNEDKVEVREDLNWFKEQATNKEKADELINAFYKIFGLEENNDGGEN